MKEHPILFSGEMVRAILDGRKTQTRRVIKPQPYLDGMENKGIYKYYEGCSDGVAKFVSDNIYYIRCPHGQPGDIIWVKETFTIIDEGSFGREKLKIIYKSTDEEDVNKRYKLGMIKWKPSIYMPRKYSRVNLEITNIRVERIQDISEDDALAEGAIPLDCGVFGYELYISAFRRLWDSINLKRGFGWDINPWVWVIEFRRIV